MSLTWNINAIRDDCISTAKHVRQSTTHDRSTAHEVTAGVGADDGNSQATRMTRLRGNQAGILARRGRTLPPRLRRLMLLVHVLVSVGALGLYLGLLTLSIVGLTTKDPDLLRAAYFAMGLFSDSLIVPVNLGVLITGLILGIGTRWGLFRYYWVTAKLCFSLFLVTASIFGLRARIAEVIGNVMAAPPDPGSVGVFLVTVLAIAVAIYVVNTGLAIYKPWGMIARRS